MLLSLVCIVFGGGGGKVERHCLPVSQVMCQWMEAQGAALPSIIIDSATTLPGTNMTWPTMVDQ